MELLDVLKILAVLASSPYWFPLLKTLFRDVQEHAADDAPRAPEAPHVPQSHGWSGDNLERGMLFNARWGAGRDGPGQRRR